MVDALVAYDLVAVNRTVGDAGAARRADAQVGAEGVSKQRAAPRPPKQITHSIDASGGSLTTPPPSRQLTPLPPPWPPSESSYPPTPPFSLAFPSSIATAAAANEDGLEFDDGVSGEQDEEDGLKVDDEEKACASGASGASNTTNSA
jgi:hypothetical protein